MPTIKGVLSFPALFTPKLAKGATEPKFSCSILIPPNDPQIASIQAEIDTAKANSFPSGFPSTGSVCFDAYDTKYAGKEYYDPKFSGWYVFSCSAKAEDKPAVIDTAHQPIIDANELCPGMVVYCSAGISGFTKGKGGIGGWLNGVMSTGELGECGRLDSKPSVDQMFSDVQMHNGVAAPGAKTTPPPPPVEKTPAPPEFTMTDKAVGVTRDDYIANGWTDEQLISNGFMLPPGGVTPSFT